MTRILRLLLIAAIALPAWLGIAATEITVCDALNTNEYVPVYGYWIDTKDVETQMIYPSSKFTGLQGGRVNQIESITFYSNAAVPAIISGATVTVRMGETNSTAFTGPGEMASNRENMVEVFSGHLASGSTTMKIDFTEVVNALKGIGYSGYITLEADKYLKYYSCENVFSGIKKMAESARRICEMF